MITRLLQRIDKSTWLASILKWVRVNLPARRGLVVLAAIGITVLSLIIHVLWLATGSTFLALCGFVFLHLAVIVGFIGILLAEALGRGYRE
ncbi:MAG: hypothetical protein IAE83_07390 [Anaerolinea sp.]|nr:hypothetical protein [Anaerolinea sp.]MCC6973318.1 hypothetical protein [Anaerolineae bacterium]CAG0959063.1 hypothetical protein ANRL4_00551 [Anaerolineae bacterium]